MNGRNEVKSGISKRAELRKHVAITIRNVLLPNELCDANKGARNIACITL